MTRLLKYVLYIMFVLSFVGEVVSIKCWSCRSDRDRDCTDPFDNRTIPLTECEERDGVIQTMCLKMTQRHGNSKVIYRGCASPTSTSGREDCLTYKEGHILMENCTCNSKRGCNSSGIISSSPWIMIISVICSFCKLLK